MELWIVPLILMLSATAEGAPTPASPDSIVFVPSDGLVIASGAILARENGGYRIRIRSGECYELWIQDSLWASYCPPALADPEDYGDNWRPRVSARAFKVAATVPEAKQFEVFTNALISGLREHNLIQGDAKIDEGDQAVSWMDQEGGMDKVTFKPLPVKPPSRRAHEDLELIREELGANRGIIFGRDYRIYVKGSALENTLRAMSELRAHAAKVDLTDSAFESPLGRRFLRDVTGREEP